MLLFFAGFIRVGMIVGTCQQRRWFAGEIGRKLSYDDYPEQPFALIFANGKAEVAMAAEIRLDFGLGRNPAFPGTLKQPDHLALLVLLRIDRDRRRPVHGQLVETGEQPALPIHRVRPNVDEIGVIDQPGFLNRKAGHLALHRHGKGAVAGIEDHFLAEGNPLEPQPLFQPCRFLVDRQLTIETDIERRGGKDDGPALHKELIDREQLFFAEGLGRHHHEQVGLLRDPTVCQVGRGDRMLLAENLLQNFEAHALPLHAELRHRRHRFGRIEGHGFGEAGGESFHPGVDGSFQTLFGQILRQRHLDHLIAAGKGHIVPERPLVEEAGGHRPKTVFLGDFFGDGAIVAIRIDQLACKQVPALLLHFREDFRQGLFQDDQLLRQFPVGRQVAGKGNRLADTGEEIAAALITEQDFLDCPGNIVFGVAQLDVEILLACHLHLDQIAETEGFELIAVLNQQVEVGVGHRRLVFAGGLQRHRPDAVLLAGFLLQLGMLQRIDKLDMHLTAAGHGIFLHQIANPRHQRGKEGMGLRGKIAANEQRLLELAEIVPGRLRNRIDIPLGHIGAQHADRRQPEVGRQKVGNDQAAGQLPLTMAGVGRVVRPADFLQPVNIEREKHPHDAEVII
ncbi:MAG: hypothetical protein ACD_75C01556G0002, partial [uncultured bacterium]